MGAARYWASLRAGDGADDIAKDMRAMGASQQDIDRIQDDLKPDPFSVWPQNIKIVHAFVRCATQWIRLPMTNQPIGLDYCAVESTLRMLDYWKPKRERVEIFEGIGIMETEAIHCLSLRTTDTQK